MCWSGSKHITISQVISHVIASSDCWSTSQPVTHPGLIHSTSCTFRSRCTSANLSSQELLTRFHSILCRCMMLTRAAAHWSSLRPRSNRFSFPLRQHKYISYLEWSSLQTAKSLTILNCAAYKMHAYRASWWLYGLTKKKSIISLLTNHFFYSLDVSSCGTERHTKVSHPLAKTEPCYRHVRQFAYPARFLRQEPISRSLRVFRLQFPLILLHLK